VTTGAFESVPPQYRDLVRQYLQRMRAEPARGR
jgi:hypothetical protein